MAENKIGNHLENLSDDTKNYIKSELAYYKLDSYKRLIKASSLLIRSLAFSSLTLLLLIFVYSSLALYLGKLLKDNYLGFLIVSGIILLKLLLIRIFGKKYFERIVLKYFNKIFKD